nr:MAG TPA: hypothetical protein [Caudoviricetes sp.]
MFCFNCCKVTNKLLYNQIKTKKILFIHKNNLFYLIYILIRNPAADHLAPVLTSTTATDEQHHRGPPRPVLHPRPPEMCEGIKQRQN